MDRTLDLTEQPDAPVPSSRHHPAVLVAWCRAEPERVGEVALLSGEGPWVLGRGEGPAHLVFARQRPGHTTPRPGLADGRLSRTQCRLERDADGLAITNTGRRGLWVNGRTVDHAALRAGDTVRIDGQLVLQLTARPLVLPPSQSWDAEPHPFGAPDALGLVGESPAMWRLRDALAFAGPRHAHVLVQGESGAGKELTVRALHALSTRAGRPLVSRSAATLPESLVDAELFGNRASYPNPGMPERPGLIGEANGSTLYLDEIGELPEGLQARLLRVLDAGEYTRLGEARPRAADLRLVAATNRPLDALKHDLAARLELRITVPGLDERRDDVGLLVRHLLLGLGREDPGLARRFFDDPGSDTPRPRLAPELLEALLQHRYTHHAREVRALLWQAMSGSTGTTIELTDALAETLTPRARDADELEPADIEAALARNDGNRSATARELGLRNRDVLYRLMKKHGIS